MRLGHPLHRRQFLDPADVDPGPGSADLTAISRYRDVFVSKLEQSVGRQSAAGDTSAAGKFDLRVDRPGPFFEQATGHALCLDDNAAGWDWFVDPTPWSNSEFSTPGDQGEQHRMDLLTVLAHEVGHLLGEDHDDGGLMNDTLSVGVRLTPRAGSDADWLIAVDAFLAEPWSKKRK